MTLKERIIGLYIEKSTAIFNEDEVAKALDCIESDSLLNLKSELKELVNFNVLLLDDHTNYQIKPNISFVKGILRLNVRGFGFVDTETKSYFIGKDQIHLALDQDEVLLKCWEKPDNDYEGEVIDILSHHTKQLVGTWKNKDDKKAFLADRFINNRRIKITNISAFRLVHDAKLLVEIDEYNKVLQGHIIKIIGYKYDPGVDILSLLLEKDIQPQFPDEVLKETENIPLQIAQEEIVQRTDYRELLTITIDGLDAKDLDDAISIERRNDLYRLYVHIADVSHYVKANSCIDKEALHRSTSVYVVDRVVPMLPQILCNQLCSLQPHVDRLTLSCVMDIDQQGKIIEYKIVPSIIRSDAQMTYTDVNKILSTHKPTLEKYAKLEAMCADMEKLASIIRTRRETLGAIDFDTKEAKIIVNDIGKVLDIVLLQRGQSERIIEDFMIAANECVATHMNRLKIPSIYRIHETPQAKKIKDFSRVARNFGYVLQGDLQDIRPLQLQKLLTQAHGKENYDVLSTLLLRSMQKAHYDHRCLGHFGLALDKYLHFTSPIRRYPDLVVHRMLHTYAFNKKNDPSLLKRDLLFCEETSLCTSLKERNAIDAERSVDDMKKAEYMEAFVGKRFSGIVSGITKFGMFVELENTVEGLVHISSMKDDYYRYDEINNTLIAQRKGIIFKMGQKVTITCVSANRYLREVNFELFIDKNSKEKQIKAKTEHPYKRKRRKHKK